MTELLESVYVKADKGSFLHSSTFVKVVCLPAELADR